MKIQGSVDAVKYRAGNLILTGWCLVNGLSVSKYPVILVNKKPVTVLNFRRIERADLSVVSTEAVTSGFVIECSNPLGLLEAPREVLFYPEGLEQNSLPIHPSSWVHPESKPFETRAWFLKFIQGPGTRVRDLETLCFLALKSLSAYRKNDELFAAALCVVFWRGAYDGVRLISFERMLRYFSYSLFKLRSKPLSHPGYTRWRVSLLNAVAFAVAYEKGIFEAEPYFQEVKNVTDQLEKTWLCVPNGVTARFVLACIQHMKKVQDDNEHLAVLFEDVGSYLKIHLPDFSIVNYWCYDELLEVTRTAQQAFQVACNLRGKTTLINANSKFEIEKISAQLLLKAFKDGLIFIR